jgi:hypothetical protein
MAPLTNPPPLTVNVNPAPPTATDDGVKPLIEGTGFPTENETDVEVPPPGVGFVTVTGKLPELLISDARMAAVNCVGPTKVVTRATFLNFTAEVLTKFVPFTVNVKAPEFTSFEVGDKVVIVGTGLLTLKPTALEVPPPGAGLTTVMEIDPAELRSEPGMLAVNWFAFTKDVVRAAPFTLTVELFTKLEPLTVKEKVASLTFFEVGLKVVIVGTGLLMLKVIGPASPPPGAGLNTVTGAVPALAMSAAVMAAVTWVLLMNVVTRLLPFHRTTVPAEYLVPLTVSVKAPLPASALVGEIDVNPGASLFIVTLPALKSVVGVRSLTVLLTTSLAIG